MVGSYSKLTPWENLTSGILFLHDHRQQLKLLAVQAFLGQEALHLLGPGVEEVEGLGGVGSRLQAAASGVFLVALDGRALAVHVVELQHLEFGERAHLLVLIGFLIDYRG